MQSCELCAQMCVCSGCRAECYEMIGSIFGDRRQHHSLLDVITNREVAEIMVVAAEAEIITAEIVVVVAVALPVGTTMVAAHPTINVAMIIILRRLVAVAAAVQTVIGWTIAAAAGDAATDPANRWDRRDRLFRGATTTGDRRFVRRWVRAGRHRCRRCVGVPQEVGLRVVSGTMDAAG